MKFMKRGSLQRSAIDKFFEPGFRFLPFVFVTQRGFPFESARKYFFRMRYK